jgi:hypothetical protein
VRDLLRQHEEQNVSALPLRLLLDSVAPACERFEIGCLGFVRVGPGSTRVADA